MDTLTATKEIVRLAGPGCWRDKPGVLEVLNRGKQEFVCACPRCAPDLYCCHVAPDGTRCENPRFKPSWNPNSILCRKHGSECEHEYRHSLAAKLGAGWR